MICVHNYVRNFDFIPRICCRLHDKDCPYILTTYDNSLSQILTSRDSTLSLSLCLFISTSRNSLTLPVSKTQLNTRNMVAYRFCDLFLSCSTFSAELVPVSNTALDMLGFEGFEGQGLRARLCCRRYLTPYFGYIILPHVDWGAQCLVQRKSQKKYTKRKDRKKIRDENISSILSFIYLVKGVTNATFQDVAWCPKHQTSKMVLSVRRTLPERERILCSLYQEEILFSFYACVISFSVRDLWEFLEI